MLQYLIIQLDDTSTSYCHYKNGKKERRLISLEDLKAGILYGMKENLMIQYILPDYELPEEYYEVLESIDHSKIASSKSLYASVADVVVLNGWDNEYAFKNDGIYVLRVDKRTLFEKTSEIVKVLKECARLNIVMVSLYEFTPLVIDFLTFDYNFLSINYLLSQTT